jgi:type IV secretory pathway TraG/TraD family ATPase VirD4
VKEAESVSKDRGTLKRNVSTSLQEVSRPLLTVDECMRLKGPQKDAEGRILTPGDMLIFAAGYAAVYGRQMLYFLDPEFLRRAKINAPLLSERTIETAEAAETGNFHSSLSPVVVSGKTEPDEPTKEVIAALERLEAIDIAGIEDVHLTDIDPTDADPADDDLVYVDSDHDEKNENEVTTV